MKKLFIITILVSFALGQEDQMYDTIFMKNGKKRLATYIEITNQGGILIRNKGAKSTFTLRAVDVDSISLFFGECAYVDMLSGERVDPCREKVICDRQAEVTILLYNIRGDEYGLTDDLYAHYDTTTCHKIVDYFSVMKYFTEKDIDEEKINDYHLIEAARSFGAQNVVTGNAYKYVVPLKYAATTTNMSADVYRINDEDFSNFSNFLGKMGQVFEDTREKASRNNAITSAGVYVNMNLYSINVADNKKKFLSKNKVVLKLD